MSILLWASLAFGQAPAPAPAPPVPEAAASAPAPDPIATAVSASLVLQVGQPLDAADALVAKAKAVGGWFQSRTQDYVSLRVPVGKIDEVLQFAAGLGKVADRSEQRRDLTAPLADARGRLASRKEVLVRYEEVLKAAGPESIVAVEQQIIQQISQIEYLEGQIRVLQDQSDYARFDVSFQFRDRTAPRRDGTSSFAWLNTLNVYDLVVGLQLEKPDWKTHTDPVTPEGFSSWRKGARFRAASPDGVLYRVRSVKHKPEADLAFWKEAVRERMIAAGYKAVAEQDLEGGVRMEFASPLGQEDWTYVLAFFLDGKKLVVAEAAGEVVRFDGRRAAVEAAMAGAR